MKKSNVLIGTRVPLLVRIAVLTLLIGTVATSTTSAAETKQATTAQKTSQAGTGGTLVADLGSTPVYLYSGFGGGYVTAQLGTQLFASPVQYPDAIGPNDEKPQPYLASSWTLSKNKLHLRLNLVHNATFSNGSRIASTDVAFTISVVRQYQPFGPQMFGDVTSVSTPNAYTAILNLAAPDPSIFIALGPQFCQVIPEAVYGSDFNDLVTDPQMSQNIVTSGPYELQSNVVGQAVTVVARKNFFLSGEPKLREIIFEEVSNPEELGIDLKSGTIQALTNATGSPALYGLKPNLRTKVYTEGRLVINEAGWNEVGNINLMEYNLKNPILANLKVRQAIADAINVKALSNAVYKGTVAVATGPIAPGTTYYDPDVTTYPFNTRLADKLLTQAGYPTQSNGYRFSLNLVYAAVGSTTADSLVKAMLAKVGIDVNLVGEPSEAAWLTAVSNYQYDLDLDGLANWGDPSIGVSRTYLCSNIRKGVGFANMEQYCNPTVDALFAAAAQAKTQTVAKADYFKLQQIITKQLPIDFMSAGGVYEIYSNRLVNFPDAVWGSMTPWLTTTVK